MRQYEEPRDAVPPGHGEPLGDDGRSVPTCPTCGGMLRRRVDHPGQARTLACDLHGRIRHPVWVRLEDEGPEPDGVRYLGDGRWGATSR
jgi:hypothetical protein